jgi:hypothetical protein
VLVYELKAFEYNSIGEYEGELGEYWESQGFASG